MTGVIIMQSDKECGFATDAFNPVNLSHVVADRRLVVVGANTVTCLWPSLLPKSNRGRSPRWAVLHATVILQRGTWQEA